MSDKDKRELSKIYFQKHNGTTIFPKLISMIDQYDKQWKQNNLIKLAKEELKESFKKLRGHLTRDKADAPQMPRTVNDEEQIDSAMDESLTNVMNAPQQLYVAPSCAPEQSSFVPTSNTEETSQQGRKCFYAPYCTKQARECGGWHKGRCSDFNAKRIAMPENFVQLRS